MTSSLWRRPTLSQRTWQSLCLLLFLVVCLLLYERKVTGIRNIMKSRVPLQMNHSTEHTIFTVSRDTPGDNKTTGLLRYSRISEKISTRQSVQKFNLTIVTAYFNIGRFQKGGGSSYFASSTYQSWGKALVKLRSPLVIYVDSDEFFQYFLKLRQSQMNITVIMKVDRKDMWSFQIVPDIGKVFKQPGYPKHPPNTVVPEYSASMHSKYLVLDDAARKNFFNTQYFAWIDVGYFRDQMYRTQPYQLHLPPNFDDSKIAMNRVNDINLKSISPRTAVYSNVVWVGGGLILGTKELIAKFHEEYKSAVYRYLKQNLMSTDQQILLSMFSENEQKQYPTQVRLQVYIPGTVKGLINNNPWFYMGYLMFSDV